MVSTCKPLRGTLSKNERDARAVSNLRSTTHKRDDLTMLLYEVCVLLLCIHVKKCQPQTEVRTVTDYLDLDACPLSSICSKDLLTVKPYFRRRDVDGCSTEPSRVMAFHYYFRLRLLTQRVAAVACEARPGAWLLWGTYRDRSRLRAADFQARPSPPGSKLWR